MLPVLCAEQGRWGRGTAYRRRARRAPLGLRPDLERPDAQQQVWRRVSGYGAVAGHSPTESLLDRLDRLDHPALRVLRLDSLRPLAGQTAVLLAPAAGSSPWSSSDRGQRSPRTGEPLDAGALAAVTHPAVRTSAG